jgi:hypothetical protein
MEIKWIGHTPNKFYELCMDIVAAKYKAIAERGWRDMVVFLHPLKAEEFGLKDITEIAGLEVIIPDGDTLYTIESMMQSKAPFWDKEMVYIVNRELFEIAHRGLRSLWEHNSRPCNPRPTS